MPHFTPIPLSDGDDDQPPKDGRQRQRSRSRDRVHPPAQAPQEPQVQPVVIQEPADEPDEDLAGVNPSLPSTRPAPSVEQRGRSRRQQRSRSRERTPPHAGQQHQPVAPHPGEQQDYPQTIQGTEEESATVEPQSRVSDHSRLPRSKESPQKEKGKRTNAEVKKPSDVPKAKEYKPMNSEEEYEEHQNEPGTSSSSQPTYLCYLFIKDQQPVRKDQLPVPTLRMKRVSTVTSTVHEVSTPQGQYSFQISMF